MLLKEVVQAQTVLREELDRTEDKIARQLNAARSSLAVVLSGEDATRTFESEDDAEHLVDMRRVNRERDGSAREMYVRELKVRVIA